MPEWLKEHSVHRGVLILDSFWKVRSVEINVVTQNEFLESMYLVFCAIYVCAD